MTTLLDDLRREADQIERVLTGVNDDESIRALRKYAAELDSAIWRVRYTVHDKGAKPDLHEIG